jgi:hypothetical protein
VWFSLLATMSKIQSDPIMISRRQLAERWGCSRETCKRREKAGILPFLKLGRDVRYRITDIERLEQQAELRR